MTGGRCTGNKQNTKVELKRKKERANTLRPAHQSEHLMYTFSKWSRVQGSCFWLLSRFKQGLTPRPVKWVIVLD